MLVTEAREHAQAQHFANFNDNSFFDHAMEKGIRLCTVVNLIGRELNERSNAARNNNTAIGRSVPENALCALPLVTCPPHSAPSCLASASFEQLSVDSS